MTLIETLNAGRLPYRTTTKSTVICFRSMQKGLELGLGWQSDSEVLPFPKTETTGITGTTLFVLNTELVNQHSRKDSVKLWLRRTVWFLWCHWFFFRKDYGIGTLHYNWPMSAHASQAFSTYTSALDCTDAEHLPCFLCFRVTNRFCTNPHYRTFSKVCDIAFIFSLCRQLRA